MGIIYIKEDVDRKTLEDPKGFASAKSRVEDLAAKAHLKIVKWDVVHDFSHNGTHLKPMAFIVAECMPIPITQYVAAVPNP